MALIAANRFRCLRYVLLTQPLLFVFVFEFVALGTLSTVFFHLFFLLPLSQLPLL